VANATADAVGPAANQGGGMCTWQGLPPLPVAACPRVAWQCLPPLRMGLFWQKNSEVVSFGISFVQVVSSVKNSVREAV
jgi:hypothetical protein